MITLVCLGYERLWYKATSIFPFLMTINLKFVSVINPKHYGIEPPRTPPGRIQTVCEAAIGALTCVYCGSINTL